MAINRGEKMDTMTTAQAALDSARRQLSDLEKQLAAAKRRIGELGAERQTLAFDAATGEKAARRLLDQLTEETLRQQVTIEDLDAACREARRRLGLAEEAAQREEVRIAAAEVRKLIPEMRRAGHEAGAALERFVAELQNFYRVTEQVRRYGFGGPTSDLARVNLAKHLQVILGPAGLSSQPIPGPTERRSVDDLVSGWIAQVETQIARWLGDEAEKGEAA